MIALNNETITTEYIHVVYFQVTWYIWWVLLKLTVKIKLKLDNSPTFALLFRVVSGFSILWEKEENRFIIYADIFQQKLKLTTS